MGFEGSGACMNSCSCAASVMSRVEGRSPVLAKKNGVGEATIRGVRRSNDARARSVTFSRANAVETNLSREARV